MFSKVQSSISPGQAAERLIDLNDLRVFAYVASLTSFSLAARALKMHKSSVSRSVARLEMMLETPLLRRTTRKVRLTEGGIELRERCLDILSRINQTIGYAGNADAPSKSACTVGSDPTMALADSLGGLIRAP